VPVSSQVTHLPRMQEFPYSCEAGVEHHNIWCMQPMEEEAIRRAIEVHKPSAEYEAIFFVNPRELQSVPTVRACTLLAEAHRLYNCTAHATFGQ
jgi:hypothetical protein